MDRGLVLRAKAGDREAFGVLARSVSDRLYAVAQRILRDGDMAEDALQETLVTVWRQLPNLRDPERFDGWCLRIVVHSCYAQLRKARRLTNVLRLLPTDATVPDTSLSVAVQDALEGAFRRLSVEHRAVFVLHHYLGLSLVEIADRLGIPAGTARSRLHAATRLLRAGLADAPSGRELEEGVRPA
jgi:RNA polymerase sigma-70 factor (ECF subfamily)